MAFSSPQVPQGQMVSVEPLKVRGRLTSFTEAAEGPLVQLGRSLTFPAPTTGPEIQGVLTLQCSLCLHHSPATIPPHPQPSVAASLPLPVCSLRTTRLVFLKLDLSNNKIFEYLLC